MQCHVDGYFYENHLTPMILKKRAEKRAVFIISILANFLQNKQSFLTLEMWKKFRRFPLDPDMECMSSQKKTSSCDQACSHVGLRNGLVLMSFAVCILFIWNICLQLKISSNSVSVNGCISINEAKKNAFKNSEPKNLEVYIFIIQIKNS